mgnify:CR=1 FL=1
MILSKRVIDSGNDFCAVKKEEKINQNTYLMGEIMYGDYRFDHVSFFIKIRDKGQYIP